MSSTGTITEAFKQEYNGAYTLALQQKTEKLRQAVRTEGMIGERKGYPKIEAMELEERTSRSSPVPMQDPEQELRWASAKDYASGVWVDDFDKLRVITDPTSEYVNTLAAAGKRRFDRTAVEAGFGTAYVGKEGTTPVPLPSSQIIESASSYFNFALLKEAVQMLKAAHADDDPSDTIHVAWTAAQENVFIDDSKVASSDFTTVRVIDAGGVEKFYRCQFHRLEDVKIKKGGITTVTPMLPKSGTTRSLMVWVKSGILIAEPKSFKTDVQWQQLHASHAVTAQYSVGGVRMDEEKVVRINVRED